MVESRLASTAALLHPGKPQALLPYRFTDIGTEHLAHLDQELPVALVRDDLSGSPSNKVMQRSVFGNVLAAISKMGGFTKSKSFLYDLPQQG